jgi:type IV secretory pathway VirB2 component (pilin)
MGGSDGFLAMVTAITNYINSGTGKAVLILVIMLAGLGMMFKKVSSMTAYCIIGGSVLVFSASWIATKFLGAG